MLSVVLLVSVIGIQSQQPAPGRGPGQRSEPQAQSTRTESQPAADPRGTDKAPLVIKVQPTAKTNEESATEKAKEQAEASAKWWTIGLGITTAIVGLLQLIAIGLQARIAKRQNDIITTQNSIMDGQRVAAETQSSLMHEGLIESRRTAEAAKESADVARDTLAKSIAHTRAIERAYVSLSHLPPGLAVPETQRSTNADTVSGNFLDIELHVAVNNIGNTPARLTQSCFQLAFIKEGLPPVPAYDESKARPTDLLLIRGDNFTIKTHWRLSTHEWQGFLSDETTSLYVLGFADYIDQFGGRHRTGWGRRYDHQGPPGNNLPYFTDRGYNYDRPRLNGEGSDWES